ncbi:MAG TPA: hypothetical protein VIC87_18635 [Vicinamibacteria bacterium]
MAFAVKPRERVLLGLLALVLVFVAYSRLRSSPLSPAAVRRAEAASPGEAVPRIDLARLTQERPETTAGRRNIFDYGVPPTPPPTPPPPATAPPVAEDMAPTPPPVPRLPPLNLKFIGSVENAKGVRVAVLLTDRNEVLTGQPGQVVANRYKISKIGFESVDLEEVGSGQVRRIPLRGN